MPTKYPFAPTRGVPQMPGRRRVSVPSEQKIVSHITNMMSKQFPGTQDGATVEAVRNFIRNQARRKGFRFSGGAGTTTEKPLSISGSAKFLLGHLFPVNFDADIKLMVNEEQIDDTVAVAGLVPSVNPRGTTDWFILNRPLAGTDEVTLTIKAYAAYNNVPYILYYI